ncbi:unnamed protein product [Withania somnifera]
MATPTINHHSTSDAGPKSPPQLSSAARGVYPPWTQIGESESTIASSSSPPSAASDCERLATACSASLLSPEDAATNAQLESSDNGSGDGTNSNGAKKPAWNKTSNGGATDVSPVMGAVSWPALSESTKASPKSCSSDSLKTLSDGSVSLSQGTRVASTSHRQANTSNVNHVVPSRQRSMKRSGGNSNHNASANDGFSQLQTQGFEGETTLSNSGKSGNSGAESSSRDNSHSNGGQWGGFGSQSHGGNDHQHQRNSNRRGSVGPHPHGDGTYHHGYGGRRDQECRNPDWKLHRGWRNRDAHMQPQRGPARPFMGGPPHTSPPFIPIAMPVQPYRTPMVYSDKNCIFPFLQVMELTDDVQLILNVVRSSTVVEVQGEKLRRRNDWFQWLMPPSVQNSIVSSPQSLQKSTPDLLVENLQRVAFDDKTIRYGNAEAHFSRSLSTELSTPSKQCGNGMAGQAGAQNSQPM